MRNDWRIADETGFPRSEFERLWDLVALEMKFHCADPTAGLNAAHFILEWVETCRTNPFLVDAAVLICDSTGTSPTPAMWPEIVNAARRRFDRQDGAGTPDAIKKRAMHNHAFTIVAQARMRGVTLDSASAKAAAWLSNAAPGFSLVASTISRRYSEEWCKSPADGGPTLQDQAIERRQRHTMLGATERWAEIIQALPEAQGELRGTRR